MNAPNNVTPLHRGVVPLSPYRMARAMNDTEMLDALHSYDESEGYGVRAMPSARATHERSLLRVSVLRMSVAIAVFCIVYFGAQLLRGTF